MNTGPFGVWMGMGASDFSGELEEVSPFKYKIKDMPRPHSSFDFYIVKVTPEHGLSWVKAVGNDVATNCYGIELKTAFETMLQRLEKVYGQANVNDFLMYESIWDEPRDWMQALEKGERVLMAMWESSQAEALKNHIANVVLSASAIGSDSGYVSIDYYFNNSAAAEIEIYEIEDEVL